MAKAPRPGKVKTRLSPPLAPEQASELNICFIRDTAENIQHITEISNSAGLVAYTPVGDEAAFDGLLPSGFRLLPQRGQGFGERLLYVCEDLFAAGFGAVCLIDSDSPTMPQHALRQAVESRFAAGGDAFQSAEIEGHFESNPHMHLMEACLAWAEIGKDTGWAQWATRLADLALHRFIRAGSGALGEAFAADWRPAPGLAGRIVEPGHQFEIGRAHV